MMKTKIKILLVYPNIWSEIFPLSVLTLSAVLKEQGFMVNVFSAEHRRKVNHPPKTVAAEGPGETIFNEFRDILREFQPDVIALSVVEDAFPLASRLLDVITDFPGVVIVGGIFATFAPEKSIAHPKVNMVCIGEGEKPLVKLCEYLQNKKPLQEIPGLWIKQGDGTIQKNTMGAPVNLDDLPTPDYSILDRQKFNGAIPLIVHRGCPYSCTFCNSPAQTRLMSDISKNTFFRKQGMAYLRRDLQVLTSQYSSKININGLYFCSDTLLAWSSREFDEFIEIYSDYKFPFVCHTTPETISSDKMDKLVTIGLKLMNIGVQHGNEAFRRDVLKRRMSNKELKKRFEIASSSGALTSADFIMGFPLETPALAQDTIKFSREIKATVKGCSLFVPYHGTALRELAIKKGYLEPDVLAVWSPEISQLEMPYFPGEDITRMMQKFNARSLLFGLR